MTSMPGLGPQTEPKLHFRLKRRIGRECVFSTAALLLLTFCLSYFSDAIGLSSLDNSLYDRLVALLVQHPASDQIVVIAIDDASIEEFGYWPWRRAKHAELLTALSNARAVGFDLVFAEPNPAYPLDDLRLASAIREHGRVALPLIINRDQLTVSPPIPELASATPYLGNINIYPDSDGVVRSAAVQSTLNNGDIVPHLSVAMLKAGNDTDIVQDLQSQGRATQRIAFSRFSRDHAIMPYNRVLDGSIPPSRFEGKYVLVGSWGSGLGDTFATPYSRLLGAMPGVEVLANILNASLTNHWIRQPTPLSMAMLSLIPVLTCCLALRYLSPQQSFLFSVMLMLGVVVLVAMALHFTLWWLSPLATLVGTGLAYPVWSWRSQHAALRHIDVQMRLLRDEGLIDDDAMRVGQGNSHVLALPDRTLIHRIQQLHQAIDRIYRDQQQRGETIRFLSHDMRSPLNSILALTELQRRRGSKVHVDDDTLAQLDHYANKTLKLVDGFISLSRAEVVELSFQTINLSELIMQARDAVWSQAQKKQIHIDVRNLPETAWIRGDDNMLERAWVNLLDNAIKYSPAETTIICTLHRDGDTWVSRIQDQGRGMDPAVLDTVFTPFVRIDENRPDMPSGMGLGLAFVRTAIARHHGHINVETQPQQGSCFTIRLAALDEH